MHVSFSIIGNGQINGKSLLDMHWLLKCYEMVIWRWCYSFIWYLWLCYGSFSCCSICLQLLLYYNKGTNAKGICGKSKETREKSKGIYDKGVYCEEVYGHGVYDKRVYIEGVYDETIEKDMLEKSNDKKKVLVVIQKEVIENKMVEKVVRIEKLVV
eukprot:156204_1